MPLVLVSATFRAVAAAQHRQSFIERFLRDLAFAAPKA
jgi:hypothetical protein